LSGSLPLLASALSFGLVGSLHCVSMCGAFAVLSKGHPAWQLGRITVYAALGAAVGALGDQLAAASLPPIVRWIPWLLAAVALLLSTAKLLGLAPGGGSRWARFAGRVTGLAARATDRLPRPVGLFLLGSSAALLPCGLLWAALGIAATAGGALPGLLTMLGFGLGSAPALAAVALSAHRLLARPALRKATALLALVVGLLALGSRIPAQAGGEAPTCDCERDEGPRERSAVVR
jgi:sulfite exporter TauE/SafE